VSDREELETRSDTVSHCTKSIKNNKKGERFITPSTYSVMCCVVVEGQLWLRRRLLMEEGRA
jgi:hypothetical protein